MQCCLQQPNPRRFRECGGKRGKRSATPLWILRRYRARVRGFYCRQEAVQSAVAASGASGLILSHFFPAGLREMALKTLLKNRVVCLAEKPAATFLCPGETSLRIA